MKSSALAKALDPEIRNLFLIGLRGSGKSTVGRLLADLLHFPFVDLDKSIQETANLTISQLFEQQGEAGFRTLESLALAQVCTTSSQVIACGGGTVLQPSNRQRLQKTGWCVWLQAAAEVLHDRVRNDPQSPDTRPALMGQNGVVSFEQLLDERRHYYEECSDWKVSVDCLGPGEVAEAIVQWLASVDKRMVRNVQALPVVENPNP